MFLSLCVCVCVCYSGFGFVKNSFAYVERDDSFGVKYLTDLKLAGFRSQLEASRVSSNTEES